MSNHSPKNDTCRIIHGDNLPVLERMASASVSLVYIDPPFNTGRTQARTRVTTTSVTNADEADRVGFGGKSYQTVVTGTTGYADSFADYMGFLRPRLVEARRILTPTGSLFFHIDWRESARCRLLLEEIFGGPAHCLNEIIWAYDYGARSRRKWSAKHDTIYWFVKDPDRYIFNYDAIDRIPYMAPGLVGPAKAARGKTPTDTWWHTIVPTNGKEKTGYPTQKPLSIVERIVRVHSNAGDAVLDFFAGSGTTGEAALRHGRRCVLIDESREAVRTMKKRLGHLMSQRQEENDEQQRIQAVSKDSGQTALDLCEESPSVGG